MDLIIDKSESDLKPFCQYLISKMQSYMKTSIDDKQLIRFDSYLNNNDILHGRYIQVKNILIGSTYHLIVNEYEDYYKISVDPDAIIPNTYAKFIDIIKLVNFGNLMLAPYPIYDTMMDYFAENLTEYYINFLQGGN